MDLAAEWLGRLRAEADAYARLALENIGREFPSFVVALMTGPGEFPDRPRDRTPVFFGSFDWHSCVEMHWVLVRFAGLQVPYSLVERTVERELLPMARSLELTVTAWSPLGDGLLTGRYGTDRPLPEGTRIAGVGASHRLSEKNLRIADAVNEIAAAHGASAAQVALAWVRTQQDKSVVIPIVGARTPVQFKENLGVLEVPLSQDDLERLDAVSRIELGFPHDFAAAALAYGNTFDLIDAHRR